MQGAFCHSAIGVALLVALSGCGGGGGGGSSSASVGTLAAPGASSVTVSGAVSAPTATIAEFRGPSILERIADSLVGSAHAAMLGLVTVADGTRIELVRVNDSGAVVASLAATTTTGGRYTFDIGAVGAIPASDLVVQAINPSNGVRLRAFVPQSARAS